MEQAAYEAAQAAGLDLVETADGLTLTDGTMCLRADFSRMLPRIKQGRLQHELLVRASTPAASSNRRRRSSCSSAMP